MATVRELCEQAGGSMGKTVRMPNADPTRRVGDFVGSTKKIDHTGDFWVIDRDTGEVYATKFPTRDAAEKWARRAALPYLSADETEWVASADPICATFFRKHPDLVLVSRLDPY